MNPCRPLLLAALLGTSAQADWLLSEYERIACDSVATREAYGVETFSNPASHAIATVWTPGSLKVDATFASDGTEGYTANLGLLHPLTPDWATADISTLTSIDFDIKTSLKPTDGWEFRFGSKVYGDLAAAGTVMLTAFPVATPGYWVHVSILPDMFAYPAWFCDDIAKPCPTISLSQVLAGTEYIQITPKTKYSRTGTQASSACVNCVTPTTPPMSFEIRNIRLQGMDVLPLVNPLNPGCLEATRNFVLDDFTDTDQQNEQGGYWYAYSDTSSTRSEDTSVGSSTITLDVDAGGAIVDAALNKNVPGSSFRYHRYAGWAALATGFKNQAPVNMTGVKAIGFKAQAGLLFSDKIGLTFKVQGEGIAVDRPHQVAIPLSMMNGRTEICVRIAGTEADVKQPSWVNPKVALPLDKVASLAWELKILDQSNPDIAQAGGAIRLDDVVLYGDSTMSFPNSTAVVPADPQDPPLPPPPGPISCTDGIRPRGASTLLATFTASYRQGVLSVEGLDQFRAIEVLGVDGRKVGGFRLDEVSLRRGVRIDLQPGAYLLVATDGAGRSLTKILPVLH